MVVQVPDPAISGHSSDNGNMAEVGMIVPALISYLTREDGRAWAAWWASKPRLKPRGAP